MSKPLISFVVILISLGFSFFYVVPAYDMSKERRSDLDTLSGILNTSGEIKTLIGKTKANLGGVDSEELARFEMFLPEKIDPIRFANNIQYIGRKNRIVLSEIKVTGSLDSGVIGGTIQNGASATKGLTGTLSLGAQLDKAEAPITTEAIVGKGAVSGEKYAITKASFTFISTYETFQLFLNDLEKSLGVIDLTSLSFVPSSEDASSKKSKTPQSPTYQYTMAIETYSLK